LFGVVQVLRAKVKGDANFREAQEEKSKDIQRDTGQVINKGFLLITRHPARRWEHCWCLS
jgi:hypothetical protein